ncbi:tryptophan synthase subunit alpha [Phytoactinopolyspora alkaliphila]|uniref:Tryptophan synthase alpha chain n=1 Tax=Phytoactinopolyspora alkaliphila TaxID=1783498 RepID=A0A6N9YFW3_9ACTN|nr:tryptophan synthase subunit alpha [Phytoactinopolyspora alkaliphila]
MSASVAFERARSEERAALVGYLPAGYPSVAGAVDVLKAMVDAGVDVVEVGLPYSDPLMDGPVIQTAVEAALRAGANTTDVLRTVEAVAATGTPTLVMSYWNPIDRYGPERFSRDLAAAGGAGVITPDIIPDDAEEWLPVARSQDLDTVFLVAPSSTDKRIALTTEACRGFVYAASTMGVTGTRDQVGDAAADLVARTRKTTALPVAVGLGVSNADQAAEVANFADGVIVGSAFVRCLLDADSPADGVRAAGELAGQLSSGVRRQA